MAVLRTLTVRLPGKDAEIETVRLVCVLPRCAVTLMVEPYSAVLAPVL